ncbi:MAG: SGNH/GDSL hydrolase family protein [Aureliella sp.]
MRHNFVFLAIPIVLACLVTTSFGQKRKPNPVMQPIEDAPGLPRVLLIGDSISIGYTLPVRKQMEGKANVHRPLTNCSSTRTGKDQLKKWLGDQPWDVIHFNFGLHDLKYVVGDTAKLVDLATEGSHKQVPIDEYGDNLREIVKELKKTKAKLIWCSTTPVPDGARGRIAKDAVAYNSVAKKVMTEADITINDLHAFAAPQLQKIQRKADVHYTPAGSEVLATQVTKSILAALGE